MRRVGAVDCGTNSIRLLVADLHAQADGTPALHEITRQMQIVRLGEGLDATGRISAPAMARTLAAAQEYAALCRDAGCESVRFVATSASRDAQNADEFVDGVHQAFGDLDVRPEVVSGQEEAALSFAGATGDLRAGGAPGPYLVVDIGGGSTELVLIEPGAPVPRILDWQSVPWGVVSLTEMVGHDEEHDRDSRRARYRRMRELVADGMAEFAERIAPYRTADLRLLGTSGTVTTLASVHLDLPQYDRRAVDGLVVPSSSMRAITQELAALSPAERRQLPCIGNERSDLVVAGCAILEAIFDIWPAPRLGVADRGIREGILRSLMAADAEGHQARTALRKLNGGRQ